jgi:hypothetical protein
MEFGRIIVRRIRELRIGPRNRELFDTNTIRVAFAITTGITKVD